MFPAKKSTRISPSIIQILQLSMLVMLGQVDPREIVDHLESPSKISQISQILDAVLHPGDILILTDSVAEFSSSHVKLFSQVSIAIVNWELGNSSNHKNLLQGACRPFIILDFSGETFQINNTAMDDGHTMTSLSKMNLTPLLHQLLHPTQETKWNPTILIILSWKSTTIVSSQVMLNFRHKILEKLFQNVGLQLDSNVYPIFLEDEHKLRLTIWEIYDLKTKRIISPISSFQQSQVELYLEAFAFRRKNFHLEELTASVKMSRESNRDWADVRMMADGTYYLNPNLPSYVAIIYWELRLLLNFSERIIIGDSLVVLPNGTLSGSTIEQLNYDKADLSLNILALNPQRASGLTFLHPTHLSLPYVFFKQPPPNSIRDNVTGPLEPKLWLSLLAIWTILVISMKSRLLMVPHSWKNKLSLTISNSFEVGDDERFARESLLWSICALCQKSWYLDPKSFSLRMQFMLGSLTALIVYTAYSTFIVSTLAVTSIPVNSFADLIESNFDFAAHEWSQPFQNLLQDMIKVRHLKQAVHTVSTEDEITFLFQPLPPSVTYSTLKSSRREVKSTRRAFLSHADIFYQTAAFQNYSSTFMCHHISSFKIDMGFNLRKSALVVKKGSQFKEILNYMLVYLINYGLTYRNDAIYNGRNILKCPPEEQMVPVDTAEFSDISIILFLLHIGAVLTLLVFALELILHHRHSLTRKDKRKLTSVRQQNQLFFS